MGNVWDRTMEVLNGRGGMLAGIAVLTLFVPGVISAAYAAYATPGTATAAIGALLALATSVAALWGQLYVIAAASDPGTDRASALRGANGRLLPALLLALALVAIMLVALLPAAVLLAMAGFDFAALSQGATQGTVAPGPALLASLYAIVVLIVMLFAGARLLPLYAVVLHERLGLGAIARSWRLTRRHTWRLVGVVLLFLIVLMIATSAAQSVGGLVFRIILGADARATVTFVAAVIAQAVSTALTLIAIVFSAQLYVALVARERLVRERAALGAVAA
ncbi:hypothetical protein [Sphingomonas sp.]|uniref:hypothetical protein n=2 Tax=unclassified Sphingomonas TaxID=196159 RepID=UPI0025D0D1F2|nr:hypothetical protein [Sphingomonas sp.]